MTNEIFREHLLGYFRNGRLNGSDKLLAALSPEYVFKKNSGTLSAHFKNIQPDLRTHSFAQVQCSNYAGKNAVALEISGYLFKKIPDKIFGAYVHGSVGTSEEIPYSDFDGLIIIKDAAMANANAFFQVVLALKVTEKMMYDMDPLQHHGWFIMTEKDLNEYPEHYFPHVLFEYGKCLFGETTFNIGLRHEGYAIEFKNAFSGLTNSIQEKMLKGDHLQDYYQLKNWLSQLLLLPAVYLQAKSGQGIFKKYSFQKLTEEPGLDTGVLRKISGIRERWNYKTPSHYVSALQGLNPLRPAKKIKKQSGNVSEDLKNEICLLHEGVEKLLNELRTRLQSIK